MIQTIIIVYGLVLFLHHLTAVKFSSFWPRVAEFGSRMRYRFLFNFITGVAECRFCQHFHTAWILTLGYGAVAGFNFGLLVVPFVVSGLLTLVYNPR